MIVHPFKGDSHKLWFPSVALAFFFKLLFIFSHFVVRRNEVGIYQFGALLAFTYVLEAVRSLILTENSRNGVPLMGRNF